MMKAFREDFARLPGIVAGENLTDIVLPPAMAEKKKPKKPKQGGLF